MGKIPEYYQSKNETTTDPTHTVPMTIIEGDIYDDQMWKVLTYKDQWSLALEEGRSITKNYVQYNVKSLCKVRKGLKISLFNYFDFFNVDEWRKEDISW